MRKFIFLFIVVYMTVTELYSAEPVIKVPELEAAKLEFIEESEEWFISEFFRYYETAVILKTQIDMLGGKTKIKLPSPTYEELSDQDIVIVKKYYKIAKALETEVIQLPEASYRKQIRELREQVVLERKMYDELSADEKQEYLEAKFNDFFRNKVTETVEDNVYKNFVIDSLKFDCLEKLEGQREQISDYYDGFYSNTHPVISVSASANKFFYNNADIQSKLSVAAELLINLNPIFEYGKYFDIWGMYHFPVTNTKTFNPAKPNTKLSQRWNTNIYAIGINGNIPKILTIDDLNIGLKIGVGHFWGIGRLTNLEIENANYLGQALKFELNFGKQTVFAPFEVFVAYSTYFHTDNLAFVLPNDVIDLGRPIINNLSLGIRIGLIRTSALD